MAGCLTLTVIGGGAEIVGFGLAFYEMAVTQRREFPSYRPVHHRALAWIRLKLGLSKPKVVQISAAASAEAGGSARLTVTRPPAVEDDLPARIARIENLVDDLRREYNADRATIEGRLAEHEQRMIDVEAATREEFARAEAERKTALRESLVYEKAGIGLFVVGVVLSVLGNAVTC